MRKLDRWTTAGAAVLIVGALLACKKKEEEPEPVASATAVPEPVKEEPKEAEAPKDELKRYGDKEINESGTVKVTVFNTKVYKEADESTSFVATLSPGTLVNRKARYGNTWMLVDYPSGVGELSPGWVLAKNLSSYIEKVKPEEVAKQDAAAPAATTTASATASASASAAPSASVAPSATASASAAPSATTAPSATATATATSTAGRLKLPFKLPQKK